MKNTRLTLLITLCTVAVGIPAMLLVPHPDASQWDVDGLMGALGNVLLFGLATTIYFLPAIMGNGKRNATAIFALNLLLGWTLIGWVIAAVWALTKDGNREP